MSYVMTHLEVAFKLLNEYKWIDKCGDFMIGAVAPDAVHFHEGYITKMKEKSHLWDCGPKWGVTIDSDKWKNNVLKFWEGHKNDYNRDFIAGYCVHILTDWLNDSKIWRGFKADNVKYDNVEAVYHIYGDEAYGSDQWLFQNSNNSKDILNLLLEGKCYDISECVEQKDLECQKKHIIYEQYKNGCIYNIDAYKYCKKDILLTFIDECVEEISLMLEV